MVNKRTKENAENETSAGVRFGFMFCLSLFAICFVANYGALIGRVVGAVA